MGANRTAAGGRTQQLTALAEGPCEPAVTERGSAGEPGLLEPRSRASSFAGQADKELNVDLLELDGEDWRPRPPEERKAKLAKLLANARAGIQNSEHLEGDGAVGRRCSRRGQQDSSMRFVIIFETRPYAAVAVALAGWLIGRRGGPRLIGVLSFLPFAKSPIASALR